MWDFRKQTSSIYETWLKYKYKVGRTYYEEDGTKCVYINPKMKYYHSFVRLYYYSNDFNITTDTFTYHYLLIFDESG